MVTIMNLFLEANLNPCNMSYGRSRINPHPVVRGPRGPRSDGNRHFT